MNNRMNILAFFAHPDDETMLMGGTLAWLARQGIDIHYLCATRGEGGEVGEPPLCKPEELGEKREQEMVCAVQTLGGRSLTFLGYTDPRVGANNELYAFTDDLTLLGGQLATSIKQHQPVAILTHGSNGEYGHPAHVVCYQAALAVTLALEEKAPLFYTALGYFEGHPRPRLLNKDDPAHLVVDIRPVLEVKIKAAMCHHTQHALFVRRSSEEVGRPVSVREAVTRITMESLHRVYPLVEKEVDDPIARTLQDAGAVLPQ
jgi:LmbE family N-acetylglucosaminyl deacetylase